MITQKCKNCNKDFTPRIGGGKKQIYCSKRCLHIFFQKTHPENIKIASKRWYNKNPGYHKEWRRKNPKKVKKYSKDYGDTHREILKVRNNKWRKENPEKHLKTKRKWRNKNRDRVNECWNKNYHSTYKKDPHFRLAKNLRHRVNKILLGINRSQKTLDLLGVSSVEEIKIYLESLFKNGMNWDNYGFYGWHIDHIRPLDSFDLTIETERLKAFHYTNLQPLWAKENMSKGKKYIEQQNTIQN